MIIPVGRTSKTKSGRCGGFVGQSVRWLHRVVRWLRLGAPVAAKNAAAAVAVGKRSIFDVSDARTFSDVWARHHFRTFSANWDHFGTGAGLAVDRDIIQLQHGHVYVWCSCTDLLK